ncbi:hypothetical protein [Empedobacter sedimenti]|uniref:hypothetical protein n=1 Tax=Empedobacter sedimenti TaxID=3042610 RepID=UPI0024A785ED|nr:hypothetical protein [Empedobacter sedimenti]
MDSLVENNWDCYILNDYEAIMPLPYTKKLGIKFITQPIYCQQLGIFHQENFSKETFQLFEKKLHRNLVRAYTFNEENTEMFEPKGEKRVNQILDISQPFDVIFENTFKDRKKDFKRNNIEKYKITQETNINKFIEIQQSNHHFTQSLDLNYFKNFLTNETIFSHLTQFYLKTKDDKILCSALLLKTNKRVILLSSARNKNIETKGGFAFLIYKIIEYYSDNQYIFDFEGSSLKGVQEFNRSFAAEIKHYCLYKSKLFQFF